MDKAGVKQFLQKAVTFGKDTAEYVIKNSTRNDVLVIIVAILVGCLLGGFIGAVLCGLVGCVAVKVHTNNEDHQD